MEARVVHLQLLVALTAQRLWALNLHTEKVKTNISLTPQIAVHITQQLHRVSLH